MGDPTKPHLQAMGLEVWAIGSRDEVDLVRRMLAANGSFAQPPGAPTVLTGADRGRVRQYFRVYARTT